MEVRLPASTRMWEPIIYVDALIISLLIGGAAKSKTHTVVKIAASKSLVVCSALTDKTTREAFLADISEEYEEVRQEHYETLKDRRFTPINVARSKALRVDFDKFPPVNSFHFLFAVRPTLTGRRFLDFDLNKLIPYIDWKPFFDVWQLRGKYPNRSYPRIFEGEQVGAEAKKVHNDAQKWLNEIIKEEKLKANAVIGFYEAGFHGDDIYVFENGVKIATFYGYVNIISIINLTLIATFHTA